MHNLNIFRQRRSLNLSSVSPRKLWGLLCRWPQPEDAENPLRWDLPLLELWPLDILIYISQVPVRKTWTLSLNLFSRVSLLIVRFYRYMRNHQYVKHVISIFVGFDALGYQEHLDYGLVQSTNPEFNKATVRVNVFRDHRQTIQVCNSSKKLWVAFYKNFQKWNTSIQFTLV